MMKLLGFVALATVATVGVAAAQPYGGGASRGGVDASRGPASATLYEFPNFQGRQTVIYGHAENLPRTFNDQARSLRLQGQWRVCEDSDYGGRCIDLRGDVPDLNSVGFAERISSLQSYDDRAQEDDRVDDDDRAGPRYGGSGGSYGGDRDRDTRGEDGARNVFFAYPTYRGADVPANAGAADRFCRSNGLGAAAYFDTDYRSARGMDNASRFAPSGPVLRDVLCRK